MTTDIICRPENYLEGVLCSLAFENIEYNRVHLKLKKLTPAEIAQMQEQIRIETRLKKNIKIVRVVPTGEKIIVKATFTDFEHNQQHGALLYLHDPQNFCFGEGSTRLLAREQALDRAKELLKVLHRFNIGPNIHEN